VRDHARKLHDDAALDIEVFQGDELISTLEVTTMPGERVVIAVENHQGTR